MGNQEAPPEPDDIDVIWHELAGDADSPDRWFAVTAASGTYGPDRLASALETEMLASRLVYLELTTISESMETVQVRARQYDISDATLVAGMLDAVRGHDQNQIESLRQPLGPEAADMLAAAYWTLPGWYEKALLARAAYGARGRSHPGLRAVFEDLLGIPDTAPGINAQDDTSREARTFALTWLDGDDDPVSFVRLYEDEDAQAAGIARHHGSGR